MKLLITTQAVDVNDSNLGFFVRWIHEFSKQCEQVTVICLRSGAYDLPKNVEVRTLRGSSTFTRAYELLSLAFSLRSKYDAVFVHMNPEYIVAAGALWKMLSKKITLWYTHKSVNAKLRIAAAMADMIFTASKESFRIPSRKVRIMGHGIDTDFFSPDPHVSREDHFLSVGRLTKSKRHDVAIEKAARAKKDLRIAGEGPERDALVHVAYTLGVRAKFLGGLNQRELRDEYRRAARLIHTSETGSLDKVVLEALACGLPIQTENPALKPLEQSSAEYVIQNHSLKKLIPTIVENIRAKRTIFLFTAPRDSDAIRNRRDADTSLRGMNYFPGAEYAVVHPTSLLTLRYVPMLLRYDFVVAQDNFLLGYCTSLAAKFTKHKTKWIYITLHSSTLLRRYRTDPRRLFLFKKWWRSYSRIVCISHEQMSDLLAFGIPQEKLSFVPFGIDAEFFSSINPNQEENLIVSVGRDSGRDYTTLFAALEKRRHPAVIVASKKNITEPIPPQVTVEYDKPLSYVRELYARAHIVVVPSKDEQLSDGSDCSGQTVILDALAAGKAVIATERSWIRDYLVPGEDLIIVPAQNADALANAIEALCADANKRNKIARNGQAKVRERYTTKTLAEGLQKVIATIA